MCLALPFYKGKIEKAPIFYGQRDTGKSTTLDVYKALIGNENMSTELLATLTGTDATGGFSRARLDGKIVNIASDISAKIVDDGMAKMLISGEAAPAAFKGKDGFNMRNYARLVFAMNNIPYQFFSDAALAKRAAIIHFDQQIIPDKMDTGFAEKLIAEELPGVLNWIIAGLDRLLLTGRLAPPPCCVAEMEQIQKQVDPLSAWLEEWGRIPGDVHRITLKAAYDDFRQFCTGNGNHPPSNKTFTQRLRGLGYTVESTNGNVGTELHYSKAIPENHCELYPQEDPCFDRTRNERNENQEQSFDNEMFHEPYDAPPFDDGLFDDGSFDGISYDDIPVDDCYHDAPAPYYDDDSFDDSHYDDGTFDGGLFDDDNRHSNTNTVLW